MDAPAAITSAALQAQLQDLWPPVQQLVQAAAARRTAVYLVGGPVRDLVLRRPLRDLDFAVEGDAIGLARQLVAAHGGRCKVAASFGTATWIVGAAEGTAAPRLDLAMTRRETYAAPAALPQVQPAPLADDLLRRDFSINAIALRLGGATPQFVDPCGGLADLQARLLRILHPQSFVDDPTRMLRAARFAGRLDLCLAPGTATALREAIAAQRLGQLSADRRGGEFDRLLGEAAPLAAVARLDEWQLDAALLGGRRLDAAVRADWAACLAARSRLGAEAPEARQLLWLALGVSCFAAPGAAAQLATLGRYGMAVQRRLLAACQGLAAAQAALRAALQDPSVDPFATLAAQPLDVLLLLAGRLADAEHRALWEWLEARRHVRSVVDGAALRARGHHPAPSWKRALAAALGVARGGGAAAAQWAAAEALLDSPKEK